MQTVAVILLALVGLVSAQTTAVSQCTRNPGDLPLNTYVQGCITPPCMLPQLQDAVINIVFKAPRMMRSMTTLATALLPLGALILPMEYNLGNDAVTCNFLTNTYCPVLQDEVVAYTLRMYIERIFPIGTALTIEFRVVDEARNPVLCIRMPIQIVEPVGGSQHALDANSTVFNNNH